MKNLFFLFSFLISSCISLFTIPPKGVAYIRDPEFFPDEPRWMDPLHIMFVNNSHFYVTVRVDGEQILFEEYIRKGPRTFYLAPRRVANMLLDDLDDKADRADRSPGGFAVVTYISRPKRHVRIELRGYLAPDFQNPLAKGEKSINIDWNRYCQVVEIGNGDFSEF